VFRALRKQGLASIRAVEATGSSPAKIAQAEDGFSRGIPGLELLSDIALFGAAEAALKISRS
jgi:hypothetical protein